MPLAVWVGVLVMFFINAMNAVTNAFHPVIALGAGLSLTQIGALSSVRSWASSVLALRLRTDLPAARRGRADAAARRRGRRRDRGDPGRDRAPSRFQIPLFALAGVSRGLLRVTGSADAFDSVGADERQHGLVAAFLYGGLDLGKIVAPVIGGVVAGFVGIKTMFVVVPLGFLVLYLALAIPARRTLAAAPRTGAP